MESPIGSPTSHATDHDALVYRILHKIGRPWHFQISQPLIHHNMLCRRPPTWIGWSWNSIWLRGWSWISLHYTNWKLATTQIKSGPIVKWPLGRTSDIQCFLPGSKAICEPQQVWISFCKKNPHLNLITKHIAILSSCICLWIQQPHSSCLPLQYWCIFPNIFTNVQRSFYNNITLKHLQHLIAEKCKYSRSAWWSEISDSHNC